MVINIILQNKKNWQQANVSKSAVKVYLQNKLKFKSVVGPFKVNPFDQPIGISPLNTRDKKDSTEKRIILDLPFLVGLAINRSIDKDQYLGIRSNRRILTVDTLAQLMVNKGVGSLLFKHDLKCYY